MYFDSRTIWSHLISISEQLLAEAQQDDEPRKKAEPSISPQISNFLVFTQNSPVNNVAGFQRHCQLVHISKLTWKTEEHPKSSKVRCESVSRFRAVQGFPALSPRVGPQYRGRIFPRLRRCSYWIGGEHSVSFSHLILYKTTRIRSTVFLTSSPVPPRDRSTVFLKDHAEE